MKRFFALIVVTTLLQFTLHAQIHKVIHQTFATNDIDQITLALVGDVEIIPWAGNTILTETSIELLSATSNVLKTVVGIGRYNIIEESTSKTLALKAQDWKRKPILFQNGTCEETVLLRIYMPDVFEEVAKDKWTRIPEEEKNPDQK